MIVLFLSVLPFQAVGTEYVSKESFWNWVASSSNIAQGILSHIPIGSRDNVCANSDDGYHHSNGFIKDGQDGYFRCVCKDCGQEFRGYASDLAPAYNDYVETLPAPGYDSSGKLRYSPSPSYIKLVCGNHSPRCNIVCEHYNGTSSSSCSSITYSFDCSSNSVRVFPGTGKNDFRASYVYFYYAGIAPVDGYYKRVASPVASGYWTKNGNHSFTDVYSVDSPSFYTAGTSFSSFGFENSADNGKQTLERPFDFVRCFI